MDLSESVEMYLVTILRLRAASDQPVSLTQMAQAFEISSVSVNEMCRKLQEQKLVIYTPYKGVTLTDSGDERACKILRRHRLWITFLIEHLQLEPSYARTVADQLEHDTPEQVADRLDDFLGNPQSTPLGDPIPQNEGSNLHMSRRLVSLNAAGAGSKGTVAALTLAPTQATFLSTQGLHTGAAVQILAASDSGNFLLQVNENQTLAIAPALAKEIQLWIYPSAEADTNGAQLPAIDAADSPRSFNALQKPLSELERDEEGIIVKIGNKGIMRKRLLDMGVVPGETISLRRKAPMGDPLEYKIKGYQLSLRKTEAAQILVEVAE